MNLICISASLQKIFFCCTTNYIEIELSLYEALYFSLSSERWLISHIHLVTSPPHYMLNNLVLLMADAKLISG